MPPPERRLRAWASTISHLRCNSEARNRWSESDERGIAHFEAVGQSTITFSGVWWCEGDFATVIRRLRHRERIDELLFCALTGARQSTAASQGRSREPVARAGSYWLAT